MRVGSANFLGKHKQKTQTDQHNMVREKERESRRNRDKERGA